MLVKPLGYEQITGLSTAKGLTVPTGAIQARIQCTAQAVRWRDDGTDPTATVGMSLSVNTDLVYNGHLDKLKLIEASASAVVNVSYYG